MLCLCGARDYGAFQEMLRNSRAMPSDSTWVPCPLSLTFVLFLFLTTKRHGLNSCLLSSASFVLRYKSPEVDSEDHRLFVVLGK